MTKTKHGETYVFTIKTDVSLRAEDMADVACSAVESRWGWFKWPENAKGRYINEAMLEDGYLDVVVEDPNGDGYKTKRVSMSDMVQAFRKYMEQRGLSSWDKYEEIMDGCTDDCVLQMAVFDGEIIYG